MTLYHQTQEDKKNKLLAKLKRDMEARGIESTPGVVPPSDACDPDCKECGGSGYLKIDPDAKLGDEKFGKIRTCSKFRIKQIKQLDPTKYGLAADEIGMTWDIVKGKLAHLRLDATKGVEAIKPAYTAGHGMIALLGTYGQGKTLVEKITVATALREGKKAAYANMGDILRDLQLAFDDKDHMTRELIRKMEYWVGLDILCIDEMDKVNETKWALSEMFTLLDRRYQRAVREEALTVVASNRKVGEIDGYLVSRLQDNRLGPVIYLNGDDARQVMPRGTHY